MILIEEKKPIKIPGITSLFVSFSYNPNIVAAIKECTPNNYDKKTKVWEIPVTRLSKFVNTVYEFEEIELHLLEEKVISDSIYDLMEYPTKPYSYQLEGIEYGLNHDNWLLLDAPGLGKTLQVIYIAEELHYRKNIQHCLIVCGINNLKSNWEKEIQKHSSLSCTILGKTINSKGRVVFGSVADRLKQLKSDIKEFFVITNIETLRDSDILKELKQGKNKFDMVVVDEIHSCKSPVSQQGRNLLKLTTPRYKIGLTGTLLLNNPLDAYVPLKWTGNDNSTYTNFKYQYCNFGGYFGNELIGYKNIDYLKYQIDRCSLRRTKDLLDLPPKNIIDEYIDMSDRQKNFYNDIVKGVLEEVDKVQINSTNLLSLIVRLRQATACPSILTTEDIPSAKIDRCCELIDEIVSNGSKVVVFSTFKDTLNYLMPKLEIFNPLLCTGDVPDTVISENIDIFQQDDTNKVMLCTHQKMGTGVTLTRASYGIFIDTPWTAGVLQQAEDRIHRIGSKDPVFIYHLWCNDTFDLRVKDIVESKCALSDYIIDDKIEGRGLDILKQLIKDLG